MLEKIYNTALHKQSSLNRDNSCLDVFFSNNIYNSIFNALKKSFLRKEMEFDNIFTQEKKYNDKYVISTHFSINSLINILNEKDNSLNIKYTDKIKKNDINKQKNECIDAHLNSLKCLNNLKNYKIKKIKYKHDIFNKKSCQDLLVKNQNELNEKITLKKINVIKNPYRPKKIQRSYKNNLQFIQNNKNIFFASGLKNINKISYTNFEKNVFKNHYQKNNLKLRVNPSSTLYENESTKWKKEIHQKILVSISNKEHEAEIHLKPENIGSISIKIRMKKDQAILNFTSDHDRIRVLLDNYIPILRHSLIKNGIFLKEVNIYDNFSLKDKNHKSSKKLFFKHMFNLYSLKKIDILKHKQVDIYV